MWSALPCGVIDGGLSPIQRTISIVTSPDLWLFLAALGFLAVQCVPWRPKTADALWLIGAWVAYWLLYALVPVQLLAVWPRFAFIGFILLNATVSATPRCWRQWRTYWIDMTIAFLVLLWFPVAYADEITGAARESGQERFQPSEWLPYLNAGVLIILAAGYFLAQGMRGWFLRLAFPAAKAV